MLKYENKRLVKKYILLVMKTMWLLSPWLTSCSRRYPFKQKAICSHSMVTIPCTQLNAWGHIGNYSVWAYPEYSNYSHPIKGNGGLRGRAAFGKIMRRARICISSQQATFRRLALSPSTSTVSREEGNTKRFPQTSIYGQVFFLAIIIYFQRGALYVRFLRRKRLPVASGENKLTYHLSPVDPRA